MARDSLGIRMWYPLDYSKLYLYLDYENKYYSFTTNSLEFAEDIEPDEKLIGPKVIVEWSK